MLRSQILFFLAAIAAGLTLTGARASEVMPPAPAAHFNDYANLVRPATARSLDAELAQFERETSNQIVVAIFPRMQSDSSIEDYTVRIAQSWHAGLKGRDNGAVLFVFVQNHTAYIQVGYGLEGALPDALCRRIIADELVPRFRQRDFDGGLTAAVHAMLAATRGEYRGTGRTAADRQSGGASTFVAFGLFALLMLWSFLRRHAVYRARGRSGYWGGGPWIFPGGGFGGGGGGSSGGGGFSGGGGSFGGGGAGGSW